MLPDVVFLVNKDYQYALLYLSVDTVKDLLMLLQKLTHELSTSVPRHIFVVVESCRLKVLSSVCGIVLKKISCIIYEVE